MTATRAPNRRIASSLGSIDVNDLIGRWQQRGDRRAQEDLCRRFLPLARKLAARYRNPNEPIEDLVQVASVGLVGAIDRFDPDRGVSFVSFAVPTILGELKRHFRNTGWTAHVPRGAQEMALQVDRATRQIAADTGRSPTVQAIADYLEVGIEDVLTGIDAGTAHYSVSLDAPAHGTDIEEPQALTDTIGAVDGSFGLVETKLSLATGISRLPHLEREALRLRLQHDMKQADIAHEMGCSQMQVSRLLRRGAEKLISQVDPQLPTGMTD